MCDCCIGVVNDYGNTRLVTLEELKTHIKHQEWLRKPYANWNTYQIVDYCDKRKNTDLTRFNYCPLCGKKIDWKAIKNSQ